MSLPASLCFYFDAQFDFLSALFHDSEEEEFAGFSGDLNDLEMDEADDEYVPTIDYLVRVIHNIFSHITAMIYFEDL